MRSDLDHRRVTAPNVATASAAGRVGVVIWTMALLSCSGETGRQGDTVAAPPTVSAAAPLSACELLPASEVTAVVGETVRDSVAMQIPGGSGTTSLSQCNYASATNPVVASVLLRRAAPGETAAQGTAGARETLKQSGVTVEDIAGLGEVAFWGGNQLHVFTKNGWYLVATPTASGGLAQAKALIERAIARL